MKKKKNIIKGTSFSSIFNPIAANYSTYFGFSPMGITSASTTVNNLQYNSIDDDIVRKMFGSRIIIT
jgi:hypothetical protein